MIRVWSDARHAGVLDRLYEHGSTFAYDPSASADRAVSLTMPVRLPSWNSSYGLAPIFEMNLPEGALRERLSRRFAKAIGKFDDFDLLGIVGRTQIGRIRYSSMEENLEEEVPFQSIDEILRARRGGSLFDYLLERFATHSGLSGVQPKVMIRGATGKPSDVKERRSPSILSATHIVKLWDADEFPELAANEYFCLSVAKRLGLSVPKFELSDDGAALVVERFDLAEGSYLGFEDFCVLNAFDTKKKYYGGYESRVFKRLGQFVSPDEKTSSLRDLYRLFVLNCAIRNGDAHLKNFGITYLSVDARVRLAPVYDLITTPAYQPGDQMALTLNGNPEWPARPQLIQLGQVRSSLGTREIDAIFEATADYMVDVSRDLRRYFSESKFEIGERMLVAWEQGIKESLGLTRGLQPVQGLRPSVKAIPMSDAALLELLRQQGGGVTATQKQLSSLLGIPQSTVGGSLRRLEAREMISRSGRRILLQRREVGLS